MRWLRKIKKLDYLRKTLEDCINNDPLIIGAMMVSESGSVLASLLPEGKDDEFIAATSAALFHISNRAIKEVNFGKLNKIILDCEYGHISVSNERKKIIRCIISNQENKKLKE